MVMTIIWSLVPDSYIKETNNQAQNQDDVSAMMVNVQVFAGNDTTVCRNANLHMEDFNAYITGLVDDGYWFTAGDGHFLPANTNNHRFSTVVTYVPGTAERAAGSVRLFLVSDDPDGIGPMVQVTDEVRITLISSPSIACNNNMNIALGEDCTQLITPQMLVTNLNQPADLYTLVLRNPQGQVIPNNIVTGAHINQQISYTVGHQCGPLTCVGVFTVFDLYIPSLSCRDTSLFCGINITPDSLGLPIPNSVIREKLSQSSYRLLNFDPCGPVTLTFNDQIQQMNCSANLNQRILRNWVATDQAGNMTSCVQTISVRRRTVNDMMAPPNFDNIDSIALECGGDWPKLANGYPHPDFTGRPSPVGCTNIHLTYTDIEFPGCGGAYHILRQWVVLDHCSSQVRTINQTIKIADKTPPIIICQDSVSIATNSYSCHSGVQNLPLPQVTDNCSPYQFSISATDVFTGQNMSGFFSVVNAQLRVTNLPLGSYIVTYLAQDECQNLSTCQQLIKVEDTAIPFAVCRANVRVSLTVNGEGRVFATSLDNASWDNCGIASLAIRKMDDICQISGTSFAPFVDFCCAEANQNVMVSLRVTDFAGNTNICMAEIRVEDKIRPIISCPSNVTVSCDYNFEWNNLSVFGTVRTLQSEVQDILIYDHYNNGYAGRDGLAIDNCSVNISSTYTENIDCFTGIISRKFVASDAENNRDSCFQIISLQNPLPFSESNITWPSNHFSNGCSINDADPTITGSPVFTGNLACANVAATFNDQVFNDSNGACIEILRTWTVIDWCQFDPVSLHGMWTRVQIIKFNNTTKPIIASSCQNTNFCILDVDCELGQFSYKILASDDCTSTVDLKYTWKIDIGNNGTFDITGHTDSIGIQLVKGLHKVFIEVEDLCRNKTTCDFVIESRDCKKPTPYCYGSLTTVLMQTGVTHPIHASDFNISSFDNCTAAQDLIFRFDEQLQIVTRTFSCNDVPNGVVEIIPLQIWVADQQGNRDFCTVELTIQDNSNVCPDGTMEGLVIGDIYMENGRVVPKVRVRFTGGIPGYDRQVLTGNDGAYWMDQLPESIYGTLRAGRHDDIRSGISALDLVLIQRHILGTTRFESPYQVIAADVNGSNSVTVADLILIRKVILGEVTLFPNQVPNWRFIDKRQIFEDTLRPWNFIDSIPITRVESTGSFYDFIGVKMGDVNHSASLSLFENETESRQSNTALIKFSNVEENKVVFYFEEDRNVSGFQFGFYHDRHLEIVPSEKLLSHFYYRCADGECRVVAYLPNDVVFEKGEALFYINQNLNDQSFQLLAHMNPEIYDNSEIATLKFERQNAQSTVKETKISHVINPDVLKLYLSNRPHILIDKILVHDAAGSLIYSSPVINATEAYINTNLWTPGIYLARIKFNDGSEETLKIFISRL